ncbi:mitochondrial carnitine acetyltransferase [Scheffersomyces amazonensis]|uniref:mitochondrial carnitine acetyltransferase n=1 Tax=Scheffersomyces amazonensis TaxID=1078765 RepID=UPI00315DD363
MASTYALQDKLEKLPIPDLNETLANYLKVLQPLQTAKEHQRTIDAVESFLKNGTGHYLDEELRNFGKTRNSYIEQFWYDSYLNYDSPVVLNLNPFFLLEDDPFHNDTNNHSDPQIKRATTLTLSSLKFIQALKNESLTPDVMKNGKPLCMYQYSKLFGASRIPTHNGCIMQTDSNSNHIVVLSKSQFYWFDVLDSENNILLTESELDVNFTSIVHDSLMTDPSDIAKSSFGVLTTENRRIWAGIRNNLISNNQTNNEILSIIDSALFVLCLDDIEINDLSLLSKNMLCGLSILDKGIQVGTCTNRWYDKLQIIITKNGKAGINFEHTGVDGHTVLRFVSDIYTDSILSFARSINSNAPSLWKNSATMSPSASRATKNDTDNVPYDLITVPRKLEWELTSDLSLSLRFGETRLSDLINQNEFRHLEFKNYGSTQIKKMRFSPDAFVQMAFQATYYALYGKVECTYEPAMTKQFFHGRTEAIRTVSQESNLFVRKFFDSTVSNEEKLQYLADACNQHSQQTRRCSNGKGVDRHLYALFCIWKRYVDSHEEEEPQPQAEEDVDVDVEEDPTSMNTRASISTLVEDDDNSSSENTVVNHKTSHGAGTNVSKFPSLKEIPSIFADSGWDKLNNTIISTSNCGNPSLRLFGFGPVSANGFGIGYIIKDDSISICASSKHRQTQRFLVTLESYLNEIHQIWRQVSIVKKNAAKVAADAAAAAVEKSLSNSVKDLLQPKPKSNLSTLLGGYGYFDMGDDDIKSRGPSPEPPFLNRNNSGFSIREIGKKLRLSEY